MSEPTKEERVLARIGLINEQRKQGRISDERAAQLIEMNMAEYEERDPVSILRRVFGGFMDNTERK